jgi:hypothetical protein
VPPVSDADSESQLRMPGISFAVRFFELLIKFARLYRL